MYIFAGYYELKIFVNEEGIRLIKTPKVYSLDEFLSLDEIKALDEVELIGEKNPSLDTISAEEKILAVKAHFDPANEYLIEIFQSEKEAQDRLSKERELREWTEDNFMFAYLEVIDGKAFEIWLRPLMDE